MSPHYLLHQPFPQKNKAFEAFKIEIINRFELIIFQHIFTHQFTDIIEWPSISIEL